MLILEYEKEWKLKILARLGNVDVTTFSSHRYNLWQDYTYLIINIANEQTIV